MDMTQNNISIWLLLYICGCLIGVKSFHTICKSIKDLQATNEIECKLNEMIYVNEQSINFLGNRSKEQVADYTECKNSTSSECFRYLAKDYSSYFNISKSCNGKYRCTFCYNDIYYSILNLTTSCAQSRGGTYFNLFRIGVSNECFQHKNQIIVRKNISETRDGSLYLKSNESGQCLVKGSIESARILEQVNMRFTVSDRKSRLCTDMLTNGSFTYNEDLSCLVGVNGIYLDIQTMNTRPRNIWIEFKGTTLQLECGDNIRLAPESGQNDGSTLVLMITGLVAGLLLLLALILIVLKRRNSLTIRDEAKQCITPESTMHEGNQNRTFYCNEEDKPQDDIKNVHEIPFTECIYSMANSDANYSQISFKKNVLDIERSNVLQNGTEDTEESRDSDKVTSGSSKTAERKPNTVIGEVTGDIYVQVCKTDGSKTWRQEPRDSSNVTPRSDMAAESKPNTIIGEVTGDVYAAVSRTDNL